MSSFPPSELNGIRDISNLGAHITIKAKMNDVDLVDRTDAIVRSDAVDGSVDITGDKTFMKTTSLDTIRVANIHTDVVGTGIPGFPESWSRQTFLI